MRFEWVWLFKVFIRVSDVWLGGGKRKVKWMLLLVLVGRVF